jgi:hypothetical protein
MSVKPSVRSEHKVYEERTSLPLLCDKGKRSPSPLTDKPLWPLLRLFVFLTNIAYAQKKSNEALRIQSDLNSLLRLQKRVSPQTKSIITLYWKTMTAHRNGDKIHHTLSLIWKDCLLSQMRYILNFFASINASPSWSEIPNKIQFFSHRIHKKIQGLIVKNLKLPGAFESIDTKKILYAYALFQAQIHSFHLTNAYLRQGIDSSITSLVEKGCSFTAGLLVNYKPRIGRGEAETLKKIKL